MAGYNWQTVLRGLTGMMNSMAATQQAQGEAAQKLGQASMKSEQDWFYKKQQMDYAQQIAAPGKERQLAVSEGWLKRAGEKDVAKEEAEKTEQNILSNNIGQAIEFSTNKDYKDTFNALYKTFPAIKKGEFDLTSPEIMKKMIAKYPDITKQAKADGMGPLAWLKAKISTWFQGKQGEPEEPDYGDIDMNKIQGMLGTIKNQADFEEFTNNIDDFIRQGKWTIAEKDMILEQIRAMQQREE